MSKVLLGLINTTPNPRNPRENKKTTLKKKKTRLRQLSTRIKMPNKVFTMN